MPNSTLVTQLFSPLMRIYRTFPPVAPYQQNFGQYPQVLSGPDLTEIDSKACYGTAVMTDTTGVVNKYCEAINHEWQSHWFSSGKSEPKLH
jgi:hypothetical protein